MYFDRVFEGGKMATLQKTLTDRRGAGLMLNIVVGAGLLAPGISSRKWEITPYGRG